MLKIYGSEQCHDCIACKHNFDKYGIAYHFIDINKNIHDLAAFLALRDHNPIFAQCKEIGDIGLPALVREDGSIFLNWENFLEEQGYVVVTPPTAFSEACSLDHKGC